MENTSDNRQKKQAFKPSNHINIGLLAHVDAGKTTLAESILYLTGAIRKLGRVDHRDAFLDTDELERARGITIFSKQAEFSLGETQYTLLDTPGHVDFSAEMERTLQVLDYAVLIISGADGVQGHVETLWRLLTQYKIPVFLFINKMDQPGTDRKNCTAAWTIGVWSSGNRVRMSFMRMLPCAVKTRWKVIWNTEASPRMRFPP